MPIVHLTFKMSRSKGATALIRSYHKPHVMDQGHSVFPEIAFVRLKKRQGWNAVWADAYKDRIWKSMKIRGGINLLPEWIKEKLPLRNKNKPLSGCWDVVAWKGRKIRFYELKHKGSDKMRPNQISWKRTAMRRMGLTSKNFVLVEWNKTAK